MAHRSAQARATSAQCRGQPWAGGGCGGSSCRSDEKRNFLRSDPDLAAACRCGWGATVPVKNLWVSRRGFRPLAGDGTSIVLLPPLNLQPTVTSGPVIPPLQKVLHHLEPRSPARRTCGAVRAIPEFLGAIAAPLPHQWHRPLTRQSAPHWTPKAPRNCPIPSRDIWVFNTLSSVPAHDIPVRARVNSE